MNRRLRMTLVEHGQDVWGRLGVFCGRTDVELTARGRDQMQALSPHLLHPFDAVYAAAQRRSEAAARILTPTRKISLLNELNEIDYGKWEGMTLKQVRREQPEAWDAYDQGDPPPEGERTDLFFRRIEAALATIQIAHSEGNVLLVASHCAIRAALASLLGMDADGMWRFAMGPAAMAMLDVTDGFAILTRIA